MFKDQCIICKAIIEYDYRREPCQYERDEKSTICSEMCYKKAKEIQGNKYYTEQIKEIPIKYRDMDCDKKILLDNYGQNLFITGKVGTGKTVLAVSIAKECIKNKVKYKWLGYSAFIMELQNMYKKDNESPFETAEKTANFSGVLIIDDLGAEKLSEWVRQITYFIINEREQRLLPIVITSNFTLEEIANQIDIRISSRIAGVCKLVKLSGGDRRLGVQDKKWQAGEPKRILRSRPLFERLL